MKKKLFSPALVLGIATAAGLVATSPADAAPADSSNTTVTFSLTSGSLNISAPTTASLGTAAVTAPAVSGQLGTVTVTDTRGQLVSNWSVSASSTDFTATTGSGTATIPATSVTYLPGLVTGTGVAVGTPKVLNLPIPVVTATGILGNNNGSWNPTLTVTLPATGAVAGDYSGTITHSVS
jgi:hypothetical protein